MGHFLYNFKDVDFRTTSLGISASGVLEELGGVLINGGGNPGGNLPAKAAESGVGVLVAGAP